MQSPFKCLPKAVGRCLQSLLKAFERSCKGFLEVVSRRFGLRGYDISTLEDVGQEIGLTRERVRQIQVEALNKLRGILKRQGLDYKVLFEE